MYNMVSASNRYTDWWVLRLISHIKPYKEFSNNNIHDYLFVPFDVVNKSSCRNLSARTCVYGYLRLLYTLNVQKTYSWELLQMADAQDGGVLCDIFITKSNDKSSRNFKNSFDPNYFRRNNNFPTFFRFSDLKERSYKKKKKKNRYRVPRIKTKKKIMNVLLTSSKTFKNIILLYWYYIVLDYSSCQS